jgi:hypothetical protein
MNLKIIPFLLIMVVGLVKLFMFSQRPSTFDLIGWSMSSLMLAWIGWAYWKDKELPAYVGNFSYQNGTNQFAITMYVSVMLFCYLVVAVVA